jgi:hypothetical protein
MESYVKALRAGYVFALDCFSFDVSRGSARILYACRIDAADRQFDLLDVGAHYPGQYPLPLP